MKNIFLLVLLLMVLNVGRKVIAQTVPVGTPLLEKYYQRLELNGKLDSSQSFVVRPIFPLSSKEVINPFRPDTLNSDSGWFGFNGLKQIGSKGVIQILPVTIEQSYSSDLPYGWNDGSMIPTRGLATRISAGVYGNYGPVSIQLRPEFIKAQNREFQGFNTEHADIIWSYYYWLYLNLTDIPERFGDGNYKKATWGAEQHPN